METISVPRNIFEMDISFKSYYVVWKRAVLTAEKKEAEEFKSYYVVWKHVGHKKKQGRIVSLNRTMQYGNQGGPNQVKGRKNV